MQKWNLEALENMMQHLSLFFLFFFKFSTGTIIQPFVGPAVFGSDFCSPHISQSLPAILHFLPLILASLGTQSHGSCKAKRAELSSPSQSDNGWQWRSGQISSYTPVHVWWGELLTSQYSTEIPVLIKKNKKNSGIMDLFLFSSLLKTTSPLKQTVTGRKWCWMERRCKLTSLIQPGKRTTQPSGITTSEVARVSSAYFPSQSWSLLQQQ